MPPSRVVLILPLFLNLFFRSAKGLRCRPDQFEDKPRQTPLCCTSGWATKILCQGEVCAKTEGETCGGNWDSFGICAVDMHCKKVTNKDGIIELKGTCVEGKSDNPSPSEERKYERKKEYMTKVKECESKDEREQCRCAEDHKDKCQSNEKGKGSGGWGEPSKFGWCFLENIIVHGDLHNKMERGCYRDMRFSERHGRFYSYKACDPEQKPNNPRCFGGHSLEECMLPPETMGPDGPNSLASDEDNGKNATSVPDRSGGLTEGDDYGSYELRSPKEGGR